MEVIHELTAQYDSRKGFYGKAMTDGFVSLRDRDVDNTTYDMWVVTR